VRDSGVTGTKVTPLSPLAPPIPLGLTEQRTGPGLSAARCSSQLSCSDALRKSDLGPETAGVRRHLQGEG
jgi:hypothetical protein